jgi:tetratricopeptide (TPR) repeat protein
MTEALAAFERALEFDRECQFEAHYAHVLIIYGTAQMALRRYPEAEQSFFQARSYYDTVRNPGAIAVCDERLGELYLFTDRNDEAALAYGRATDQAASMQNWGGYVHTKSNIASTLEKCQRPHPLAREAYQEAIRVAEREQLDSDKARALRIAGWVELMFGDYPLALRWLRESICIAARLQLAQHLRTAAQGLFRYALQTETLWLAAWLKVAFLADPETDDEILDEIHAVELPAFAFDAAPDLRDLANLLLASDLSAQPAAQR